MAELIEILFALRTQVGSGNHVLDGVQIPHGKGQFSVGIGRPIVTYRGTLRSFGQKWLNRSTCCLGCGLGWAQGIVLDGSPDPPWEGAILGERGAHCKV